MIMRLVILSPFNNAVNLSWPIYLSMGWLYNLTQDINKYS